jgi:type VI secretion system protein ImpF
MSPRRQDEPNIVPSVLDRLLGDDPRPAHSRLSADSELDALWVRLLDAVAARLRPEVIDAWVRPCRLLAVEADQWRVAVPDRLLRDRLVQQYRDALQDSAAEIAGGKPRLAFIVDRALGSYGIRELKQAVARDLEALLNTRQEALDELPESLEEVRRSLVVYGLPDFTAASLQSPRDRTRIRRALEDTIAAFEPRLDRVRISLEESEGNERAMHFRVEGWLRLEPNPEPVSFDTVLQLTTREYTVQGRD